MDVDLIQEHGRVVRWMEDICMGMDGHSSHVEAKHESRSGRRQGFRWGHLTDDLHFYYL